MNRKEGSTKLAENHEMRGSWQSISLNRLSAAVKRSNDGCR